LSPRRFGPRSAGDEGDGRFPLPPALARLTAGDNRLPREFVEQNQRDRILMAALEVFGTTGFAAATVQDLVGEARVSRETFYKHFTDKEACLREVHDEVLGWLEVEARDAAGRADGWPVAVLAVCERLLGLLADDPRVARLVAVESLLGGVEVKARYEVAITALASALREGRTESSWGERLPVRLERVLLAGAMSLIARRITDDGHFEADLSHPELTEIILMYYLGHEEAHRIAHGPS
jgi:AcrR family transcriptional regulator